MNEPTFIDRPPRIQPELPTGEVDIPVPPRPVPPNQARLIQVGLPLLTILGFILVSAFSSSQAGGRRSSLLLIPMGLSVLASVGFSLYTLRRERQLQAEAERAYEARLSAMTKELHTAHDLQRRFYSFNYPDLAGLTRIVHEARDAVSRRERSLRSVARLWERRTDDADFGAIRLGVGSRPSTVTYNYRDEGEVVSSPQRAAAHLAEESRLVSDAPITLLLRPPAPESSPSSADDKPAPPALPVAHAVGLAGERDAVYAVARAMLAHFAVFHAPGDARLYLLASNREPWHWAETLPHARGDEQTRQLCFLSEIAAEVEPKLFDDDEGGELEQYLEGIRKTLAQRKIRMQEHDDSRPGEAHTLPLLLLVVDLLNAVYDKQSPIHGVESDAALAIVLEEGAALGAAVIFLVPERSKIPGLCKAIVELERTAPAGSSRLEQHHRLHFRYAETGINGAHIVGLADAFERGDEADNLAAALAGLQLRLGAGAGLAAAVPFLDLMGHRTLASLLEESGRRWHGSVESRHANWLRVKIGRMPGNKQRTLVFSAKRDGVHGMVAGSTGSGKSELLISLIAGMAVSYDPSVLNFVLVDYKGGGAFADLKPLPHCVDIITNLAADGVTRMFTAITAEMKRRQALNAVTGTKNIVEYRQKGLHLSHAPYPFLFIIIDEFAEMIADRAEYKSQLESITRVGRAQGVSLLLAAQRPSGVTDQMRSNIKFRICLRVETGGESREMLRRTDAAFLPPGIPGRGYLQVGNEEIELIQVAYTGDRYADTQRAVAPVIWPDRPSAPDPSQDQAPPELYKVIVESLAAMATAQGSPPQRAPWPKALPAELYLSERLVAENETAQAVTARRYLVGLEAIGLGQPLDPTFSLNPAINRWLNGGVGWVEHIDWGEQALRPVLGLIDNPYNACQHPLSVELQHGHAIVFGASGSGKTTMLRTLVTSLAATHSPDYVHFYVLDLGGRNLSILAELPHVGAVVIPDEEGYEERVGQVIREIEALVERRKTLLSTSGASDLAQYNREHPADPQPAVVLVIDNFVEFRETFGGAEDNVDTVLSRLVGLARQGRPYGVHLVAATAQVSDLSSQQLSLFTERFTLRLTDPIDYRTALGVGVPDMVDLPGRGYVRAGALPLAFQVALPVDLRRAPPTPPANELKELGELIQRMNSYLASTSRAYKRPVRVDALPSAILLRQILGRVHQLPLDAGFLPQLEQVTRRRWAESLEPDLARWLSATIGVVAGNQPRTLRLEAKEDGVHGMVAGGTGAGKSELLMTLIVDLALGHDPSVLQFVLVDYKGGGAFKPFERLPHCVESMSNLNKSAVRRMFTAIGAEMQRRQALNAATNTKDIVEYRNKGYHLTREPYPHLFIIIDEYAEMISDSPEFGGDLDSITRVGRAQGVNLLLASQRPTGVSDQMRANIKLRICLRVEGTDTSREMLRRSDAAFLPNGMPGRGYMQVGNEQIELIQVAWTGEGYEYAPANENGERPRFFDVAIDLAAGLLAGPRPLPPWPPFLPHRLTLGDALEPRYLDRDYLPLLGMGRHERLALNPFAQHWLDGQGAWPGVDWEHTALRAVAGVIDDPYNARQLPLVVDFTRGHAVVFGASGSGKTTMLRALALSLAATHTPGELHMHILDLGAGNLEVMQSLPHVGTLITPTERGYEERLQQLWREIEGELARRKELFNKVGVETLYQYNAQSGQTPEPAILVLIDNILELIETFGASTAQKDEGNLLEAFVSLARQGKPFGLHFMITAPRLGVLSTKLYSLFSERLTLRLANADEYGAIVGSSVPEPDEIPGRGYVRVDRHALNFQTALVPGTIVDDRVLGAAPQVRAIGERMQANLAAHPRAFRRPLRIGALPRGVSFRQMFAGLNGLSLEEGRFLGELEATTRATWARNRTAAAADWLRVPIGIVSGDQPRALQLEAKEDGVHGMVAGGTGSGKSELLMTLIVSLALSYPPDILNFVLVDYKGGGAFKPFERLPHCVDIVTNLNPAAVTRMFTAIDAEMQRRQGLNAVTGTKDIVEYRKKGHHLTLARYPHLFIIIDEYAEMIDANDGFRQRLDSITRVGRAQGVNLLLASQQPKGVSDQMRANIKLRICLRVEQMETSRELLRRPDAALLPSGQPGRGYLQVGNEQIELIQVAWTGEAQPDDRPAPALWPERPARPAPGGDAELPRFFDTATTLALELNDGVMAPRPWPAFLPERFSLESPLLDAQRGEEFALLGAVSDWVNGEVADLWPGVGGSPEALRPVIGLVDDPVAARQEPLRAELGRAHLAIFGDAGVGKTTLLRTLLVSLAATYSPEELHVYVVDLGGRNFRSLEAMPHLGAALYADDEVFEERLQRLLDILAGEVERRQGLFSASDVGSLSEYNTRYPAQALPAVAVLIDNFAGIQENVDSPDRLIDERLIPLLRRGLGVGLSFTLTANVPTNLPGRLYNLLSERLTLRQSNLDRYMDIVGRGAIEFGDIPGRGYIRREGRPLLLQIALPAGLLAVGAPKRSEAEELRALSEQMEAEASRRLRRGARPDPVHALASTVALDALLEEAGQPAAGRIEALLGRGASLQPTTVDLRRSGPHCLIVGPPMSGKTTALYTLALSLARRYPPAQVAFVLIDLQRRFIAYDGRLSLGDLPHALLEVTEGEQLAELTAKLKAECESLAQAKGRRGLFVLIDNFDDFSEELEAQRTVARDMAALARRHGGDGLHFVVAATPEGGNSELKRRILAANFGLALRTAQAADALRVQRTPPELRGRELPPGRGFVVKAGQSSLVQVALPYEAPASGHELDDTRRAAGLDRWVEQVRGRYPGQRAAWADGTGRPRAQQAQEDTPERRKIARMLALVRRGVKAEFAAPHSNGGNGREPVGARFMALEPEQWQSHEALRPLLGALWLGRQVAQGVSPELAQGMLDFMDDESLMMVLEGELEP